MEPDDMDIKLDLGLTVTISAEALWGVLRWCPGGFSGPEDPKLNVCALQIYEKCKKQIREEVLEAIAEKLQTVTEVYTC